MTAEQDAIDALLAAATALAPNAKDYRISSDGEVHNDSQTLTSLLAAAKQASDLQSATLATGDGHFQIVSDGVT